MDGVQTPKGGGSLPAAYGNMPSFMILVVTLFMIATLGIAGLEHFPSPFDELAHLSVIRAQWEHSDLFADTRSYGMLAADDLSRWSGARNFINHPALYYWLMSPLIAAGNPVLWIRLANALLATIAFAAILWGGCRLLATQQQKLAFAILSASFPKFILVGGIINNDNLAMVASAAVLAGLAAAPGGGWLVALGLALAGWSKLTALIAMAAAVGVWTFLGGRASIRHPDARLAAVGALVGAAPFLANYFGTGALFHVNDAVFSTPANQRPDWGFVQYAADFFQTLALKWPAAEGSLPIWLSAVLIAIPIALCVAGVVGHRHVRRLGLAYLAALAITCTIHLAFGWRSFVSIGDLTIPQTRYYAVIWPGIALAAAPALASVRQAPRILIFLALLVPTVFGGLAIKLL